MTLRMNLILLLGLLTSSAGVAADGPVDSASVIDKTLVSVRHSNEKLLMPGDFDGDIARTTGLILQQQHYSQKGFNSEISSKFLDRYLDTLDGLHLYFLKSDVESFEMFRKTLDKLTLRRADPTPAYAIFNRFMDRVEQQYAYVHELLHDDKGGHWDFSTDERYTPNRKDLERPKDLTEAKQFWRSRIRYEYLQEKLNLQRAEDIGRIVREKAEQKKPAELMEALKDAREFDTEAEALDQFIDAQKQKSDRYAESLGKLLDMISGQQDQMEELSKRMQLQERAGRQ